MTNNNTNPSNPREDDSLKQQVHRLIIENQSDDGSIDISDQNGLATEFLGLISTLKAEWEAEREKALIVIHRNLALRLIDDMYLYNRGIAGEQKQVIIDKLTMGSSLAVQTNGEGNG